MGKASGGRSVMMMEYFRGRREIREEIADLDDQSKPETSALSRLTPPMRWDWELTIPVIVGQPD